MQNVSAVQLFLSVCLLLSLGGAPLNAAPTCSGQEVSVQVLGSGGPQLQDRRASSSYLIWHRGRARVLIDAGAGSSLNFERSGARIEDLQAVLLTHLHVDHSADLPAYVKASYFTDRNEDLALYGPAANALMPSTTQFVQRLLGERGAFAYLSEYVDAQTASAYKLRVHDVAFDKNTIQDFEVQTDLTLKAISVHHGPVAALAWRVQMSACVIVFSGDASNRYHTLARLAQGADILIAHNAIPESAKGVARNLHMPPSQIALIAQQSGVKRLLLSHRMLRTLGREPQTLKYIRARYAGPVMFADDLDRVDLP